MCYDEPTIQGQLDEVKGKLKQKDGQLTDDDLRFAEGIFLLRACT
jgi:uncharacterized protein YjbJ (UPF0337 family)